MSTATATFVQHDKAQKSFFDNLDESCKPALLTGIKDLERATTESLKNFEAILAEVTTADGKATVRSIYNVSYGAESLATPC